MTDIARATLTDAQGNLLSQFTVTDTEQVTVVHNPPAGTATLTLEHLRAGTVVFTPDVAKQSTPSVPTSPIAEVAGELPMGAVAQTQYTLDTVDTFYGLSVDADGAVLIGITNSSGITIAAALLSESGAELAWGTSGAQGLWLSQNVAAGRYLLRVAPSEPQTTVDITIYRFAKSLLPTAPVNLATGADGAAFVVQLDAGQVLTTTEGLLIVLDPNAGPTPAPLSGPVPATGAYRVILMGPASGAVISQLQDS